MWISNAPFAQVAVVWAKDEAGDIQRIDCRKWNGRFYHTYNTWQMEPAGISATGELVFDNVKVPKENIFPNVKGLKGPLGCLTKARYGIAWGAIGAPWIVMILLLRYSKERVQFGQAHWRISVAAKKTGRNDHRNYQSAIVELATWVY